MPIASNRAYNSALKMLAVSGNRTHLGEFRHDWTTASIGPAIGFTYLHITDSSRQLAFMFRRCL